jgi:hypothetical protein
MTDEVVTLYCSGCQEPTSFPAKVIAEVPAGEPFIWDCRPCGHRNRTMLPVDSRDPAPHGSAGLR